MLPIYHFINNHLPRHEYPNKPPKKLVAVTEILRSRRSSDNSNPNLHGSLGRVTFASFAIIARLIVSLALRVPYANYSKVSSFGGIRFHPSTITSLENSFLLFFNEKLEVRTTGTFCLPSFPTLVRIHLQNIFKPSRKVHF